MIKQSKNMWIGALAMALCGVGGCFAPSGADDGSAVGADSASGGGFEPSPDDGVGPAVGQGGAQDFGQFRQILEDGNIPGPETLDDVGFFAEHRIDLGPATCDDDVCLQGSLAVMGNMVNGNNCTMVMMGMTTPIDIESMPRPPLNLAIAIDTSGSMLGAPIDYVRSGLLEMQHVLRPEDRITLIAFADGAEVLAEALPGDDPALREAIESITAEGRTNVYGGLRSALEYVDASADSERQNRVLLLSDGESTTGVVNDARVLTLAEAYAARGISVSTIGMGESFDPVLMRGLAETGGGAFYFVEDPAAVEEVFVEEAQAFLLPLARNVVIEAEVADGYELRGVFGTQRAVVTPGRTRIEIPSLQLAHRVSSSDNEGGRRGGGGAMVLELTPESGASGAEVGTLRIAYDTPWGDTRVEQEVEIRSPLDPGETPGDGFFEADGTQKAFVTLNLYAGFEMAAVRAAAGDGLGALQVLEPLGTAVEAWLEVNPDADIEDDLRYVDLFIENLEARGIESPMDVPPPAQDPWPQD
ncbi:MAG: VWA domain-containing protein [Nannocystaceae bacterium]|nr:VWA domain-containing protein [Nannocystaceae bacterium]